MPRAIQLDVAWELCSERYPRCRQRGGLWLIKALNHYSTVRMKQSRYQDALEMLLEMESLVPYDPDTSTDIYVAPERVLNRARSR